MKKNSKITVDDFQNLLTVFLISCVVHVIHLTVLKHLSDIDEKFTVCSDKYNYLIAREYKLKVVEKHFSEISKLSRADVRQMKTKQKTELIIYQINRSYIK